MSLLSIFEWLERTPVSQFIHAGAWQFPSIEILHIAGSVLLFGTMLVLNLRLLGLILQQVPVAHIAGDLASWGWLGLSAQFVTGPLLLTAEATKLYSSGPFRAKVALLLVALVFQFAVRRAVAGSPATGSNPLGTRFAAAVSLTLWLGVIVSGLATVLFE